MNRKKLLEIIGLIALSCIVSVTVYAVIVEYWILNTTMKAGSDFVCYELDGSTLALSHDWDLVYRGQTKTWSIVMSNEGAQQFYVKWHIKTGLHLIEGWEVTAEYSVDNATWNEWLCGDYVTGNCAPVGPGGTCYARFHLTRTFASEGSYQLAIELAAHDTGEC
jgi:hypothetical protein